MWYAPLLHPGEGVDAFSPPPEQLALLDAHELERYQRLVFPRDRRAFLRSHVALREVLAHHTGIPAGELRFELSPYGRPSLTASQGDLSFNLSQTRRLAAVVVAKRAWVGVDVETPRDEMSVPLLAGVFSASAQRDIHATPEPQQLHRLLQYWTMEEAYLKATGLGIIDELNQIELDLTNPRLPRLRVGVDRARHPEAPTGGAWSLHWLSPPDGHVGALALWDPEPRERPVHEGLWHPRPP